MTKRCKEQTQFIIGKTEQKGYKIPHRGKCPFVYSKVPASFRSYDIPVLKFENEKAC